MDLPLPAGRRRQARRVRTAVARAPGTLDLRYVAMDPEHLAAACATVRAFADGAGAQRVVVLLDVGDAVPVLVERLEDGALEVVEGDRTAPAPPAAAAPLPLPPLVAVPASAIAVDPETGELAAPLGGVQRMADAVIALARACGGRSVATATFATRDPAVPLTIAAREGEDVVIDVAGRHFSLPR
jgi:hypothetical protein